MSDAVQRLKTQATGRYYGLGLVPLPLEEGPGRQGSHRPKGKKMGKFHDIAEQHRERIIRTTRLFDLVPSETDVWLSEPGYEKVDLADVRVGDEAGGWMKNNLRATLVVGVGKKNFTLASSSPGAISDSVKYGYQGGALITVKAVAKEQAGPFRRPVQA